MRWTQGQCGHFQGFLDVDVLGAEGIEGMKTDESDEDEVEEAASDGEHDGARLGIALVRGVLTLEQEVSTSEDKEDD